MAPLMLQNIAKSIKQASRTLATTFQIETILLKGETYKICNELKMYNDGYYVALESRKARYLSRIYLIILFLLILAGMPS